MADATPSDASARGESRADECAHGPLDKGNGYCLACDLAAEVERTRTWLHHALYSDHVAGSRLCMTCQEIAAYLRGES